MYNCAHLSINLRQENTILNTQKNIVGSRKWSKLFVSHKIYINKTPNKQRAIICKKIY